jgi:hypothetical protein
MKAKRPVDPERLRTAGQLWASPRARSAWTAAALAGRPEGQIRIDRRLETRAAFVRGPSHPENISHHLSFSRSCLFPALAKSDSSLSHISNDRIWVATRGVLKIS